MAFVPSFTTSQPAGALTSCIITDASTDASGITTRIIRFQKYDGDYLVPTGETANFVDWPIGTDPLTITDLLDKDYCLDITVYYYTGSTLTDTKTILTLFTGYADLFLRQLTQATAANKITITAQNFWVNKNRLRVRLDDASQAVSLLNDQTIAQFCLDDVKTLTDNLSSFF